VARVGWIFGQVMARHYRQGAAAANGSPSQDGSEDDLRPPELDERIQALLRLDLDAVPSELKSALRAQRSELHDLVKRHKHETETSESRLESLIAVFEDLYESSTRVASKE
jgi:ribosome recycling factor